MQDDAANQNHAVKISPVPNSTTNGSDIKLDGVFVPGGAEPLVSHAEQNGRQYDGINNVITSLSRMNVSSLPTGNGITSVDQGSNFWASQGMQGFQSEDGSNVQLHISGGNSSAVMSSPNIGQLMTNQIPAMVGDGMLQVANRRPITGQQLFHPGVTHNQAMFSNQQSKMWPQQQQQQALLSQNQQNIALQNWLGQNMPPDVAFQRFFSRLNVPSFDKSFSYTPDVDMSAVLNAQGSKYGRSTSLPGQYGNFAPRMGFDALNVQPFDGHFDNGGSYFPYNKVRTPDVNSFTQLESMRYHMNDGSEFNNHSDLDGFKASHQQQYYRRPSDGHLKGVRYNNFPDVPVDRSLAGLGLDLSGASGASGDPNERYSRKVFVGGLPPDIDEAEITAAFCLFGSLMVDWPHKAESKSYFPPKGYCFLIFRDEFSVRTLAEKSMVNDGKLYWCVSSPTMKDKPVQIRPWCLADSDFVLDASQPLDPRKTIFVGGVPRPLKALELAMIMDRLYGGVCYAGIDTDPELKYPKGAGRIAFSSQQSYINAISARFIQLQHGDIDKRVEVKPYVLDDQLCDECQGVKCGGKFAPFFCANVTCLQYYCEHCWAQIHSHVGREYHKPLVKEGADRPRAIPFRWGQGGGAGFNQAS